jgi:GNAT superfamily N-acetyltransferase
MENNPSVPLVFQECTDTPDVFFNILPDDWKESIVPFWPDYKDSTRIFILEESGGIVGGGLVFSKVAPDTIYYEEEAQSWFDRGYLYLAYIWVAEKHRGRKLGTVWLQKIHNYFKNQKFWLAIEDYNLVNFYSPNGYVLIKKIKGEENSEWIMARN